VKVRLDMLDSLDSVQRQVFDAASHRPGFRCAADAERAMVRDARDEMIERAKNAWRTPARDAAEPDSNALRPLPRRAYAEGKPDLSPSSAAELEMRRHLRGELLDAAEAARLKNAAWEEMRRRLASAWQTGRTDPSCATAIMRQSAAWWQGHGRAAGGENGNGS
jgi:hypothetical protein